jgi:ATP-dependent RNA helicase DeaD
MDIALAAVKLAHEASGAAADEEEIPDARAAPEEGRQRGERGAQRARTTAGGVTRVFIGAGRTAGIRPQDVVGAIAGESSLSGRDIGAIEIADRFTLVEVPDSAADEVIAALRGSTIKGRKPTVRRERYEPGARRRS